MWLRKLFLPVMAGATVALPLWVLIAPGLLGDVNGWDAVSMLLVAPLAFVALLVAHLLTGARRSVREHRALAWRDLASLLPWWAAIIVFPLPTPASGAAWALSILLGVVAMANAVTQLVQETRRRFEEAVTTIQYQAQHQGQMPPRDAGHWDATPDNPRVIILPPQGQGDAPLR